MIKRFLSTGLAACFALASVSAHADLSTTDFTATYKGTSGSATNCTVSYTMVGKEPTSGKHPLFIYTVGTTESNSNGQGLLMAEKMAAKGYVAAVVGYQSTFFASDTVIARKAKCMWDSGSTNSAVSALCARSRTDCSKGIVTAGFSQGAIIAAVANNYDSRVRAAFGIGLQDSYVTYPNNVSRPSNRVLPKTRLRVANGMNDYFNAGNAVASAVAVTGYNCGANNTNCLQADGSGYILVQDNEVSDGKADHCYARASGACIGSQKNNDPVWATSTLPWAMPAAMAWLNKFVTH
jgi:hypothetical protein